MFALARALIAVASLVTINGAGTTAQAQQGSIVADTFWSAIMTTRKREVVYLPPSYLWTKGRRYPVAYYLHGAYGGEDDWTKMGRLATVMDSLIAAGMPEMIVVMPDGDDGWYTTWNSLGNFSECTQAPPKPQSAATYCVQWPKYDDYIARDLVAQR